MSEDRSEEAISSAEKKSDWKLLDVPNILLSLILPLLKTISDAYVLSFPDTRQNYVWEKHEELINKAGSGGRGIMSTEVLQRELIKKGSGFMGACVGAGLGIAICSPGGLMPSIDSDYGKLSDAFRQDFSKLGGGDFWDKFSSQALWGDVLNVLLCVLFIAACTVVGKALFMGIKAGVYNSNLSKENEDLRIGLAEALDEAVLNNSVKFFSAIEKKLARPGASDRCVVVRKPDSTSDLYYQWRDSDSANQQPQQGPENP